jgi:hypothetical protein
VIPERIEQVVAGEPRLRVSQAYAERKENYLVSDRTPYAIHQDNALISTSKGLAEWGKYLAELKK